MKKPQTLRNLDKFAFLLSLFHNLAGLYSPFLEALNMVENT